jgi:RNA polymerase sigma-70 factor (ECF subfamily)
VVHEQDTKRLLDAVRALPLIYREIVLLTLEGLDYREISEVVGISESNVGARLSRARQHLRKALEQRA